MRMKANAYKGVRTNTRRLGIVESEPGVARQAFCNTNHRTARAGLCNAVRACAHIRYEVLNNKFAQY